MLSLDAFEAYLKTLSTARVLNTRNGLQCPIAMWLKSYPHTSPFVSHSSVDITLYWGQPEERFYHFYLPGWAVLFVREIDRGIPRGTPIYVQTARDLIAGIRNELCLPPEPVSQCEDETCTLTAIHTCYACRRPLCTLHAYQSGAAIVCHHCLREGIDFFLSIKNR
jgi:hypothetical protein